MSLNTKFENYIKAKPKALPIIFVVAAVVQSAIGLVLAYQAGFDSQQSMANGSGASGGKLLGGAGIVEACALITAAAAVVILYACYGKRGK